MIETTIPGINVVELMERVRAKADEIRRLQARPKLPPVHVVLPIPRAVLPSEVVLKTEQIAEWIRTARDANTVPRWIPKIFRGLFRRQEPFNRHVLRTIGSLAQTNAQLADRLRHLTACVEVQDHSIHQLADLRTNDGEWMQHVSQIVVTANEKLTEARAAMQMDIETKMQQVFARVEAETGAIRTHCDTTLQQVQTSLREEFGHTLREADEHLRNLRDTATGTRNDLDRASEHLRHVQDEVTMLRDAASGCRGDLDRAGEHLRNLEGEVNLLRGGETGLRGDFERAGEHLRHIQDEVNILRDWASGFRGDLDRAGEHLRHLQAHTDRLTGDAGLVASKADSLAAAFGFIREEFNRTGDHLRNLQAQTDRLSGESRKPLELEQAVARLEQRLTDDGSYLKSELSNQRTLLSRLAIGTRKHKTNKSASSIPPPSADRLDAFYLSFEDAFRGPRQEIKRRLEYYLPFLPKNDAGKHEILDLGCGRGEWLELLKDREIAARGVDLNGTMCAQCNERGLRAVHADAVEYLRTLDDRTLRAVTGFHIIEHLPLETLLDLFAETHRVLAPGGLVIFESPNCKNYAVGACTFNIDPTHRNPVYPETAEFMLTQQGFVQTKLHYLSPVGNPIELGKSPVQQFVATHFFGPQDFSVTALKL